MDLLIPLLPKEILQPRWWIQMRADVLLDRSWIAPTMSYSEMVDPMLMFTSSDAPIADILPSAQVEETLPSGKHAVGSAEETFVPFDFEEAFVNQHGITPEAADVPASKWKSPDSVAQEISIQASSVRSGRNEAGIKPETHPHGETILVPHHCHPGAMHMIQTHGSRIHTQDTMARMDPYAQATIQVDPWLLRCMPLGRWAAQELNSIDPYHQENFYQYSLGGNPYTETDPYHWSIPWGHPLGISNSSTPQTPSIVTTTDTGQVSTEGPSA